MGKVTKILIASVALLISLSANATEKMNVLLVLTDDQGYGDLACNGNPYLKTPHIDKLASESYRFSNYHVATTCAPTRSGLMSSMYCNKAGVWHTIMGRSLLDLDRETMGDVFNKGGYATGMFGKWHLGDNYPYRPFDRGFETTLWHKGGGIGQGPDHWGTGYFNPTLQNGTTPEKHEGFCTDVFFDNAMKFMKKSKDDGRPFFCYLATNAAHSPFIAPEEYTKRFEGNTKIPNAAFYGMIENLDDNMGRMEEFLKQTGLDKNTIVIYTTDNGSTFGEQRGKGYNAGMKGKKGDVYEGGHRVPFFMRIPNTKGAEITQLTGYIDVGPTLYEICGIKGTQEVDGISVKSVIDNPSSSIDRYLLGDTQRQELMYEDNKSVVMKGNLRLINKTELYDISTDEGQKNNIASKFPEVVKELAEQKDKYWAYIAPENDRMHPIYLSTPTGEDVVLNSHDRHVTCIHTQGGVKKFGKLNKESFWAVRAPEDGEYTFELLMGAPERGKLKLEASIVGGKLIIGDTTTDIEIENGTLKVEKLKLKKGDYKLEAKFKLTKGETSAYYVRITK